MTKRLILTLFILTLLIKSSALCYAQDNGAWLTPRTVYVGDPATLVVPLPPSLREGGDVVIDSKSDGKLYNFSTDYIDINRIVLERRVNGSRLLVEFTAFSPGIIELPVIEIDGESFSGLSVKISSLLDTSRAPELSGVASALAIPGTAAMLYGTIAGIVFAILLSVWIFFRGRYLFRRLYEKWKRWSLFIFMKNTEKNLYRLLIRGHNKREILDKLSDEFRAFLTIFTGNNCRSMTAREFEKSPLDAGLDGVFLKGFFRRCDDLRFSGADVKKDDISRLLADLHAFLSDAEREKKEKAA